MVRPKANTPEGIEATKKYRMTMLKKYGSKEAMKEQYRRIGKMGGLSGKGENYKGGFAYDKEKASEAGRIGGLKSRRDKKFEKVWKKIRPEVMKMYNNGDPMTEIAKKYNIPYYKISYRIRKEKNDI